MLAVETRPSMGVDNSFLNMNNTVKGQINDMANSGHYYVTPEINRELRHINNGIDHIRLDNQFLNTSPEWGQKWNPARTSMEMQGATQAIHGTALTMNALRGQLGVRQVKERQDNQVREQHHHAVGSLRSSERDLAPFAHQSVDRIKQFCEHVGVTDRYTGYRNNLSRGSRDPVRLGFSWIDQNRPATGCETSRSAFGSAVKRVNDPRMTASATGSLIKRATMTANCMNKDAPMMTSIQEQCGINTTFPGNTEYMVRYVRPPLDPKSVPITVNPNPNSGFHGRPQMRTQWEPRITEYQRRFEFPDSSKMIKLPWVKKF